MSTVVTGAAGFLGSRLARALLGTGRRVIGVDLPRAPWRRLEGLGVERRDGDITDREAMRRVLAGATEVFHVAALYELGTPDAARMRRINVDGTRNVIDAAFETGARVVHVSSVAALGPTGEAPASEGHWNEAAPTSIYAATKREAHLVARARMKDGQLRIAMPATIWGEGDPSMLGRAAAWLARSPVVPRVRPTMRLCFVHVDDCADGIARVADRGRDGEEYVLCAEVLPLARWIDQVANPRAVSLRVPDRLLDAAARLDGSPWRLLPEAAAMSSGAHWSFTGDKARRTLGWVPRTIAQSR